MLRSVTKAVIVRDERVLLQRCQMEDGGIYYELPGGGQNAMETLEEAIVRECLEETGYTVRPIRPFALLEEILDNATLAAKYPGFAHRVFHVFLCEILDVPRKEATEEDYRQVGLDWMPLAKLSEIALRPAALRKQIEPLLREDCMAYLGAERIQKIV